MSENIPIFLASDNNYAPFVASTIASICDNTRSFIDFYILDSGISEENRKKIESLNPLFTNFSIEFIKIDAEKEFEKIAFKGGQNHFTISTYNRFLIAQLKQNLSKCLYLDVDIIVLGDIADLYAQNLDGYTVGAVQDQAGEVDLMSFKSAIGLKPASRYFNAGIMIMNLHEWREKDITAKLFDIENAYRQRLKVADQDILNIAFEDNFKLLADKYNVQYGASEIVVRHFVNVYKPWKANYFMLANKVTPLANFDDFWKYAKITSFYDELKQGYEKSINSSILTKRMSMIADKMRSESNG